MSPDFFEAVDRRDVRMVERRQHLRLALEARQALRIARPNASGSTLIATSRSSFASRARYTSPIPPAPSGDEDLVGTELGSGCQTHFNGAFWSTSVAQFNTTRSCGGWGSAVRSMIRNRFPSGPIKGPAA